MRKLKARDKAKRRKALGLDEEAPEEEVSGDDAKTLKRKIVGDEEQSDPSGDESAASDTQPVRGSPEEVAEAAIAEILEAIEDEDLQAGGVAFIPPRWALRYKHALGPYKKFLQSHPNKFCLEANDKGGFVVRDAAEMEPPAAPLVTPWKPALNTAWTCYCKAVPRSDRNFSEFVAGLPAGAQGVSGYAKFAPITPAGPGDKKRLVNDCPGQHGLRGFEALASGFGCNRCEKKFKKGTQMYGCRVCDYDICGNCYIKLGTDDGKSKAGSGEADVGKAKKKAKVRKTS